MDKEKAKMLSDKMAEEAISDPKYWFKSRYHWDEWGSPVGLGLAWALLVIPTGIFLYLLHIAGLIG